MKRRSKRPRRGALMVCVFACMVVVASMIALLVKDALAARRETKLRLQLHQTERLLDAGILRAAIRSGEDAGYVGETWQPKRALAAPDTSPSVTIVIDGDKTKVSARIGIAPNITSKSYVYSSSKVQ